MADQKVATIFLAELIGTFALVFTGCGAVVTAQTNPDLLSHAGVSAAFGLVIMVMIYSVGNISGAHFNPAVTLGFYWTRRLEGRVIVPYIAAQCAGAVLAGILLRFLFPGIENLGATVPEVTAWKAVFLETLFTFILMFVILNVSTGHMEKGIMAGVAVGGTVALIALMGGPLTGASMNPARSLGPAVASGVWQNHWIYWIAPLAGSLAASPFCKLLQGSDCCETDPA